jgi:hypothetical protein
MTVPTQQIAVGVLSERAAGERRVALIPADIKRLMSSATFVVEGGAGREAGREERSRSQTWQRQGLLKPNAARFRRLNQENVE